MLELVHARELDAERVVIEFADAGVRLRLPHLREADWTIDATIAPDNAVVTVGPVHEHFDADETGRPWPSLAVDFIAEILRGEIEIETEYRGAAPIRIRHFVLATDGQRHELGMTGLLRPALLMRWRPTRTEVLRVTFDAQA